MVENRHQTHLIPPDISRVRAEGAIPLGFSNVSGPKEMSPRWGCSNGPGSSAWRAASHGGIASSGAVSGGSRGLELRTPDRARAMLGQVSGNMSPAGGGGNGVKYRGNEHRGHLRVERKGQGPAYTLSPEGK